MKNWKIQFTTLWIGQAVSLLTSAVLQMGIVWYLIEQTGSEEILSVAMLVGYVPQAVLGMFVGAYIDRYSRKAIMILSDLAIAATGLMLVFASAGQALPLPMIFFVLFVRSVGAAFHEPSLKAVTPLLVPEEQITRCVGLAQSFESLAYLVTPALAALLYAAIGLNALVLLDAAGAVFAALLLAPIHIPRTVRTVTQNHLFRELREGIAVLQRKKGLLALLLVSALYAVIYFPIGNLYPLLTMKYFGGTVAQSSVVEMLFSAGGLGGMLLIGWLGERLPKTRAMTISMLTYGILLLAEGLLPTNGFPVFLVLTAFLGLSAPVFSALETAILEIEIEDQYRGRVLSLASSLTMLAMPVGVVLAGVFAGRIGANRWFFLSGILTVMLAILFASMKSVRHCCDPKE